LALIWSVNLMEAGRAARNAARAASAAEQSVASPEIVRPVSLISAVPEDICASPRMLAAAAALHPWGAPSPGCI
jgi:hypothetical protein